MNSQSRDEFVKILRACIGRPYIWGGQDMKGFDCSGLIIYCLNQCGIKTPDTNAQGLFKKFAKNKVSNSNYLPGCLSFYGDSDKTINHVMAIVDVWSNKTFVLAGARGGDSKTINVNAASSARAFVDVTWGDYYHTKLRCIIDPFKEDK